MEGETLSCGSGMVATALVVMANNSVGRVELVPLSGDRLVVEALGDVRCYGQAIRKSLERVWSHKVRIARTVAPAA